MKKKILVIMGGLSGERKISFLTGKACCEALKKKGFEVVSLDAKGHFLEKIKKNKPNVIFNALHGKYGEDGFTQSVLESLQIPYTHSGVLSSSLAMDKELSRIIFKKNKINVPKSFLFEKNQKKSLSKKLKETKIKFPTVVKPVNEGSSLGVYICKNKNFLIKKLKKLIKLYEKALVEEYIPGREIQVAIMGNKTLGAIELAPKRKFYDYKAKYSVSAKTKHIMPAPLSKYNYKKVLNISKKAHRLLKCRGVTRADFKFHNNKFYLLEINTQPGMTKLSLVPEIAKYAGIAFDDLVSWMANDASLNR